MIDLAHIHPMLVHFPIVLFLGAVGVELLVLLRGEDPAARGCLSNLGLAALLLGTLAAAVAAFFGDIALDRAVALGFPRGPLETHQGLAITTLVWFAVLSALYLLAWWRRYPLSGGRGWLLLLLGLCGIALLLLTAYHGGDLVYRIGVNVLPVHP